MSREVEFSRPWGSWPINISGSAGTFPDARSQPFGLAPSGASIRGSAANSSHASNFDAWAGALGRGSTVGASTARLRAASTVRLQEFQRNAAYVSFMCIVVAFCVLQMVSTLRSALIPLVWASFFALPLQRAVDYLNLLEIQAMSWVLSLFRSRRRQEAIIEETVFWHTPGLNRISVDNSPENAALLEKINNPFHDTLGRCPRRQKCTSRFGFKCALALRCCRRRVRVTYLEKGQQGLPGTEAVNCLQVDSCFHIGSPETSEDGTSLLLKLYLDTDNGYPAVIDEEDAAVHRRELMGTFDVDKTSQISWMVAMLLVLLMVFGAVMGFVSLVYMGAVSLQDNLDSYIAGVTDMINYLIVRTERFISRERWDEVRTDTVKFLTDNLPSLAEEVLTIVSETMMQAVFFTIYLLFWLSEPLPVSPSIAGVFKSYLFLKTLICLLFAVLMSSLLAALDCKIWPLFFVVTFLLNYIPEIGSIMVGLLAVPAVLFDGSVPNVAERVSNTFVLAFVGSFIKFLTGNIIEVQMYATRGGEFMRMHPVVLMAMMFVFGETLGITGMFLSVPIVAAVKYQLVSANVPDSVLNPLLVFIEGDETAPHRHFVDKWRTEQATKKEEQSKRSFITNRSRGFSRFRSQSAWTDGAGDRDTNVLTDSDMALLGATPSDRPTVWGVDFGGSALPSRASISPWAEAPSAATSSAAPLLSDPSSSSGSPLPRPSALRKNSVQSVASRSANEDVEDGVAAAGAALLLSPRRPSALLPPTVPQKSSAASAAPKRSSALLPPTTPPRA